MIGSLRGKVIRIDALQILIEVNSIGYEVIMPASALENITLNTEVFIYIQQVIREDSHTLYGFTDISDKKLFIELLKANGIGPKSAVAILSKFNCNEFINAISQNDIKAITSVPGIGKKTAERVIIEFKDKIHKFSFDNPISQENYNAEVVSNNMFVQEEAISALVGLGYKDSQAHTLVKSVYQDGMDTREIILKSLAILKGK